MRDHLTDSDLGSYRAGSLEGEGLLAVDDHLSRCPSCQLRLGAEAGTAIRFLRSTLKPVHLEYADLQAYADGRLDAPVACEHLRTCPSCKAEAEDLRAFAAAKLQPKKPLRNWWWAAAAVACAALVLLVVWVKTQPQPSMKTQATVAPEYQTQVDAAIAAGRIDVPARIAQLAGRRQVLLGTPDKRRDFRLLRPIASGSLSDRPEFEWQPIQGARTYKIAIYDLNYNQVAISPPLTATHWHPDKPLTRGKVYSWQVSALLSGGEVTAPQPPAPEAKFEILSQTDWIRLEGIRSRHPQDHLALGVLYGQAGAFAEAESELKLAIASGPRADAARTLLQSLPGHAI